MNIVYPCTARQNYKAIFIFIRITQLYVYEVYGDTLFLTVNGNKERLPHNCDSQNSVFKESVTSGGPSTATH